MKWINSERLFSKNKFIFLIFDSLHLDVFFFFNQFVSFSYLNIQLHPTIDVVVLFFISSKLIHWKYRLTFVISIYIYTYIYLYISVHHFVMCTCMYVCLCVFISIFFFWFHSFSCATLKTNKYVVFYLFLRRKYVQFKKEKNNLNF